MPKPTGSISTQKPSVEPELVDKLGSLREELERFKAKAT